MYALGEQNLQEEKVSSKGAGAYEDFQTERANFLFCGKISSVQMSTLNLLYVCIFPFMT